MKIEHDVLVGHLHVARREKLKYLYSALADYTLQRLGYEPVMAERLLTSIRELEATDIFQKARDLARDLENLEEGR